MKKTILATLLISTTILAGTVAVHADDLSGKSTAKIGLTKQDPDNPVGPIDPIDPDDNPPYVKSSNLEWKTLTIMEFGMSFISQKKDWK